VFWSSPCHPGTAGMVMSSVTVRRLCVCSHRSVRCSPRFRRARPPRAGQSGAQASRALRFRLRSRFHSVLAALRAGILPASTLASRPSRWPDPVLTSAAAASLHPVSVFGFFIAAHKTRRIAVVNLKEGESCPVRLIPPAFRKREGTSFTLVELLW